MGWTPVLRVASPGPADAGVWSAPFPAGLRTRGGCCDGEHDDTCRSASSPPAPIVAAVVQGWLDNKWSPEQSRHSLLAAFPAEPARQLAMALLDGRDAEAAGLVGPVWRADNPAGSRSGRWC